MISFSLISKAILGVGSVIAIPALLSWNSPSSSSKNTKSHLPILITKTLGNITFPTKISAQAKCDVTVNNPNLDSSYRQIGKKRNERPNAEMRMTIATKRN